jgi:fatty acid desaturase
MNRSGILRYDIDVWPVALVLAATLLGLLPFLRPLPLWQLALVWGVVAYLRTFCAFVQHNHAHLPAFRSRILNHVFDVMLAQNTGYPSAFWVLHHNLGHHRHYLDPVNDVASTTRPRTRVPMSRVAYALRGNLTILRDSIRIAVAAKPPARRGLLAKLILEIAAQVAITGVLFVLHPGLTICFFVIPNILTSFLVWWESYPHHLNVPMTNVYDSSMTTERRDYNFATLNIGHHTAHHQKPTLHWSLLPGQTARIRHLIPSRCINTEHTTLVKRWSLARSRRSSPGTPARAPDA